jgi:predicted transcriptional regulator
MAKKNPKRINSLGDLEADVMGVVWEMGRATVQDVKDALAPGRSPAYTTVMTVMSRLAGKGMLERQKEGRAYYYTPAASQEKVAGSILRTLVNRLYDGATGRAVAQLLKNDSKVDDAELERLERLIRSKRGRRRP